MRNAVARWLKHRSPRERGLAVAVVLVTIGATVELGILARKGSLFTTRATMFDYYAEPVERAAGVDYVFDMFRQGVIAANIGQTYALEDAAQAHRDLEAGKTTGATILRP